MARRKTTRPASDRNGDAGDADAEIADASAKAALKAHRKRHERAWSDRDLWQKFYDDAYEFAIPYRRPASRLGKAANTIERLFDATAIESSFRAAGQLHADLFPPGFFKLAAGAVAKVALPQTELDNLNLQLETVTTIASAFFETGEFDLASSEMCIDLLVGTGSLLPVDGDARTPVRFVCVPFDELAIDTDAYGKVTGIFWKSKLSYRNIKGAFKNGKFPKSFEEALKDKPDDEIDINQDFIFEPDESRWCLRVWLRDSDAYVEEQDYKTQPMAVPRYHRVPGEAYGRGPILLALPTIKTLNKAVELTLKAAAIQMLGIWGYRPGGSFNPDTQRLAPGEFWPMQATGGVLGPDVTRLDAGGGKVDLGNLVTQELRQQVTSMLGDDKLPADGATPRSATEIMERMKRIQKNYMGAWARIVNEVIPVIVMRVLEILAKKNIKGVPPLDIDALLVKVDVMSPITQAIKAAAHQRIIEFIELVIAVKGQPMAAELIVRVDDALRKIAEDQLPRSLITTKDEQKAIEAKMAQAAAAVAAAQAQPKKAA